MINPIKRHFHLDMLFTAMRAVCAVIYSQVVFSSQNLTIHFYKGRAAGVHPAAWPPLQILRGLLHVPIERGLFHASERLNLLERVLAGSVQPHGMDQLFLVRPWPAAHMALGPGRFQPLRRALRYGVSLKLCNGTH